MSPLSAKYTRPAIILHWLIGVMILINLVLVWTVDALPEAWTRPMIDTHKSIGITVLGLAIMRILWRAGHPPPALLGVQARWERISALAVHAGFYALIFALPLSGWMHDSAWKGAATHPMFLFGVVPWPRIAAISGLPPALKESLHTSFGDVHTAFAYLLYALLAAHITGALKHQFKDRQPELQRMWF